MRKDGDERRSARTLFLAFSLSCFVAWPTFAASGPVEPSDGGLIDLTMYRDPVLPAPEATTTFDPRLKSLWLTALRRPDAELRRQALQAFGEARGRGLDGLEDVVPAAIEALTTDEDVSVRLAAATALDRLDDPAAAAALLQASERDGTRLTLVADRALARWKHQPAIPVWQTRVSDPAALLAVRLSAARALGVIGATAAVEALAEVAADAAGPVALRLQAAEALAQLAVDGLVPRAHDLQSGTATDRVIAARMLAGHTSRDARLLLDAMIVEQGQDAAIVAEAARSLLAIDPAELAKRAETLAAHADPGARLALAQALLQLPKDDRQPHTLGGMLDDASVEVRDSAREGILAAAAAGQDVRPVVSAVLAGGGAIPFNGGSMTLRAIGWRGLEQAAFIAGKLDHEAAADRLIELLRHDRPEVRVAAATALRQLALTATLPAIHARVSELTEETPASGGAAAAEARGEEATQLLMAIGEMRFMEADALLRRYIPKNSGYHPVARAAAIYALGKLHEGTTDSELVRSLSGRLNDLNPMEPEMTEVRRFAAIALGRMKAESALTSLRRFYQEENSTADIGGACRWAIMQITGESLPELQPLVSGESGWFLEPVN